MAQNTAAEMRESKCVPIEFNEERVEKIRPIIVYISVTILIFSALLDVATFKWRMLADWILYFEATTSLITNTIPSVSGSYSEFFFATLHILPFILISTDTRG